MQTNLICIHTVMLIFAMTAILASIIWLMFKGSRSRVTFSFIGCQSAQLLWVISQLMILFSESERQLLIGYAVGNLGISFLGTFWLLFAISYMDREVSSALKYIAISFSLVIFICAVTNPIHHSYYMVFSADLIRHGILFYISQAYIYITLLCGIAMVCRHCFENKQRSRGQAVLLTLATGIPLIINLLTLTNVISLDIALTPITLALSGILVLLATYRYGFLNVNDAAFEDAFNSIEEGIIVFSRRGRITYISPAAKQLLHISEKTDLHSMTEFISEKAGVPVNDAFDYAEIETDTAHLSIKHYLCRDDKGIIIAQLFIVSDITRYYQLVEKNDELAGARQKLAIEQERNRIAQEVHDTAGHTFTMISSLAGLSRLKLSETADFSEKEELLEFMNETESLARGGLTQLRCSINALREENFMNTVTGAVHTAAGSVRGIDTEICIQGIEDESYSFCVQNIYSSLREIVTNCVRYSGADRIDIIVKFLKSSLELYVFDNGIGCGSITAHNGLRGISERTAELGGTASFKSSEGSGFSVIIKIPVHSGQEGSEYV